MVLALESFEKTEVFVMSVVVVKGYDSIRSRRACSNQFKLGKILARIALRREGWISVIVVQIFGEVGRVCSEFCASKKECRILRNELVT